MPQIIPPEISSLCSTGMTFNILTGCFLQLLRSHWATESNIENEKLRRYLWTADPKATQLWIEPVHKWNFRVTQRRPAILLRRNAAQAKKIAINDMAHGGISLTEEGDRHVKLLQGSHAVLIIGREGAEVEALAAEVYKFFLQWAPVLRKELKLTWLEVGQIGAIGQIAESKEHFGVPLVINWAYAEAWKIKTEAPLLKVIEKVLETTAYTE